MNSADEVLHQPETLQQPALMKKKSNPVWKVAFIILFFTILLIVNVILISNAIEGFQSGGLFAIGGVIGIIMSVALIDLIGVVIYMYTQQSSGLHGISRSISYAVLTVAILALVFSVIIVAAVANLFG